MSLFLPITRPTTLIIHDPPCYGASNNNLDFGNEFPAQQLKYPTTAAGSRGDRKSRGVFTERFWRRPTLPGGLPPSTIGAGRLNFRVRNGNGCIPAAITTRNMLRFALMRKHVLGLTPSEPKVRGTTVPEHSIAMHDPSLLKLFVSSKLSIEPKPSAD